MPKFDTTKLSASVRSAETTGATANSKLDDLRVKHDEVIRATRAFNAAIEPTREAVAAAVKAAQAVGTDATDLAATLASIPEPIPEPIGSSETPPTGVGETMIVRRVG